MEHRLRWPPVILDGRPGGRPDSPDRKENHVMQYTREQIEELLTELTQQRDHLKIRLYFAKNAARDEWLKLEPKFEQLKMKLEAARAEAGRTSVTVGPTLDLAVEQVKKGYERVRQLMR